MTDNDKIKHAFELSEDPNKIIDYYDRWAQSYEKDLSYENYTAPMRVAELALEYGNGQSKSLEKLEVLDAGCGTGLLGRALAHKGFKRIVGFDLSPQMVEVAERTNSYDRLHGRVDMNKNLTQQINRENFNIVVSSGVFTLGHVPPQSLINLIDITTPHGIVAFSAREEYCQESNMEEYLETLQKQQRINIKKQFIADYVSYDRAMYACIEVLPSNQTI